jgi:hypothetical protein
MMEPGLSGECRDLRGLRLDLLQSAAEIYLALAYPSGSIPEVVQRRLRWRDGCEADELLKAPPFERVARASGRSASIYALRLGNYRYPHMKLQIQPWPNDAGFMLSVNTHDQVSGFELNSVDVEAFRELQAENQRIKEEIEHAWDQAGLPTFHRYLSDYIKSQAEEGSIADVDGPSISSSIGPSDPAPQA